MIKLLLLLLFLLFNFSTASADKALISKIKNEGLRIVKFSEGLYHVQLKKRKLKKGAEYLVVRVVSNTEFDLLGQGNILTNQDRVSYLKLDQEKVFKKPLKGDYIIPLSSGLDSEDKSGQTTESELVSGEVDEGEPGYLQFAYGYLMSDYTTESSTLANFSKVFKYNITSLHFKWYLDFAWQFGIEINTYSDDIPTRTYKRRSFDSARSRMDIDLMYRLKKWKDTNFRSIILASLIDDKFSTDNKDEFLLTTNYQLFGLGTKLSYELNDNLWSTESWGVKINSIYASAVYYLLATATDVDISRGTGSASGLSYSYSVGADILFYWEAIPLIKRWYINLDYQSVNYDIKFDGPTVSEDDPFYKIPENGKVKESDNSFKIMIGFRVDDFIGKFFKPR